MNLVLKDIHALFGEKADSIAVLGDCMEAMKGFADKTFSLAIVDPPYFSGPERRRFYGNEFSNQKVKRIDYPKTDTWQVPDAAYFEELKRVSEHQIIWGCNYFPFVFGPGRIIWDKCNHDSSFSDCEQAYCSLHDSTRLIRYMWNGMMQGKSLKEGHIMQGNKKLNEKKIHPTQKPVLLYKWLLDTYAKAGDTILDTHLGSGSSRIAAYDMSIGFYGVELSQEHYDRQNSRFEKETKKLRLFV